MNSADSQAAPVLRLGGVPEHFNYPVQLALESGELTTPELDVQYRDFPGGTGAMCRALAASEIDAAILLTEGGVTDILNGGRNQLVKVYVESPLIWGIHVPTKSSIQTIEEVHGAEYAISRNGSGSHLMAIVDASARGWAIEEMRFEVVGGLSGALQALPAGEADVFLWERFTTQPYVDQGIFRRIDERRVPWPAFAVSVRAELLEERKQDIKFMLQTIERYALKVMQDNTSTATIAKRYEINFDDVKQWFGLTKWCRGFERPDQALNTVVKSLQQLKIVPSGTVELEQLWCQL